MARSCASLFLWPSKKKEEENQGHSNLKARKQMKSCLKETYEERWYQETCRETQRSVFSGSQSGTEFEKGKRSQMFKQQSDGVRARLKITLSACSLVIKYGLSRRNLSGMQTKCRLQEVEDWLGGEWKYTVQEVKMWRGEKEVIPQGRQKHSQGKSHALWGGLHWFYVLKEATSE